MWLLYKLRDALLKKKGQRAAIIAPQTGAKAEKENPGTQLGHINKQADAQGTAGCKNCPAPARKGASISLATGNESFTHTDFVLAAPLPIEWARTYASDLDAFDRGSLGARWITPYSMGGKDLAEAAHWAAESSKNGNAEAGDLLKEIEAARAKARGSRP